MISAMNGALMMPTEERVETDRRLQPRQKSLRTDAAIAPGDAHSAEQSGDIGKERQERQADDQREDARKDQNFDRVAGP